MKHFILTTIIIVVLSNNCFAQDSIKIQPYPSLRLTTEDYYELAIGTLFYGDSFGYAINIEGNHEKIGLENVFFIMFDGDPASTRGVFVRPKIENYLEGERSKIYGLELGYGVSGHSPFFNVYLGSKYDPNEDEVYSYYIGIGMNL